MLDYQLTGSSLVLSSSSGPGERLQTETRVTAGENLAGVEREEGSLQAGLQDWLETAAQLTQLPPGLPVM